MEEDCAVHVFFPVRNKGFRLAPELIEFVGHGATAIRLKGSSREWLKSAAGGWTEVDRATRHGGKP